MRIMRIESCLVGGTIEFLNRANVVIATTQAPKNPSAIEGVLSANGVHPDDIARQASDIRKQLAYDLDFCF